MIDMTCEICGKTFKVKPYRKNTARFCSFQCSGKWHQAQRPNMGNRFKKGNKVREGLRPTNAFISEQVRGKNNPKWIESIEYSCEHCGKTFGVKPWLVRQNGEPRYCSHDCYYAEMPRDEQSPLWVGGPKTYRGRNWKKARLEAINRDRGICQDCGKHKGESIPVHHIKPFREFQSEAEANEIDNLICLCQSCHMKREAIF